MGGSILHRSARKLISLHSNSARFVRQGVRQDQWVDQTRHVDRASPFHEYEYLKAYTRGDIEKALQGTKIKRARVNNAKKPWTRKYERAK